MSVWFGLALAVLAGGCIGQPQLLPVSQRRPFDRRTVEYPPGFVLTPLARGLDCPTALCFDYDRNLLLVAESGIDGSEPHIFGYHLLDGKYFNVYPFNRTVSFFPPNQTLYGPIGGMVVHHGRIYVSHRDRDGRGMITAFGYDGSHATVVANLPAQGDYGVTDLAVSRGRLYFGIGMATNSGVVGLDNWDAGWLREHPDVCDQFHSLEDPPRQLIGNGPRFGSLNPRFGLGQPDKLLTAPFQPFGHGNQDSIPSVAIPNGAICSVALDDGGDLRVFATGLHNPRGLAFGEYNKLFATLTGMQLRGTRPIADDPDALLNVAPQTWYGAPDYSTTGKPVTLPQFAPPRSFIKESGYSSITPLINLAASGLSPPYPNLAATFPSLSGAAKLAFVPEKGPFGQYFGSVVVALDGDRAPYASGGLPLLGFIGGKVAIVDVTGRQAKDFVFNTAGLPASRQPFGTNAIERPCDVKFGPDGALYILDFGQMENDTARPRYHPGTGAIYKLDAVAR